MHNVASRMVFVVLIVIIYFILIRPLRAEINRLFLTPVVSHGISVNVNISSAEDSRSVSNAVLWGEDDEINELFVTVPFGLTFLVGIVGLLMIGSVPKFYGYLVMVQLLGGFLGILSFYLGAEVNLKFLIVSDFAIRYLTPLCSMGLVPLSFIYKKQESTS